MITRSDLLQSSEYWFEEAQNELYAQVVRYMEKEGLNQNQLAEKLGVTKGYVSQILKGKFNYTLKKLIEISLAIGQVPKIKYSSFAKVIEEDNRGISENPAKHGAKRAQRNKGVKTFRGARHRS